MTAPGNSMILSTIAAVSFITDAPALPRTCIWLADVIPMERG